MSAFKDIASAVRTVFEGLAVTLSHMVRKPITVQYPDRLEGGPSVVRRLPERYRGLLEVNLEICTACSACERACPIDCIVVGLGKDPADAKRRVIERFDIDLAKCMFCGLCTEPCPTAAIHHTAEFEGATASVTGLVFRFVAPGECVAPYKLRKGDPLPPVPPSGEVVRRVREASLAGNAAAIVAMVAAGVEAVHPPPDKKKGKPAPLRGPGARKGQGDGPA